MTDSNRSPRGLDVFPEHGVISPGERSDAVGVIQTVLNALKIRYDSYGFLDVNFTFDDATAFAVREFRRIHRLPDGDEVDEEAWNELAREYALLRDIE